LFTAYPERNKYLYTELRNKHLGIREVNCLLSTSSYLDHA